MINEKFGTPKDGFERPRALSYLVSSDRTVSHELHCVFLTIPKCAFSIFLMAYLIH